MHPVRLASRLASLAMLAALLGLAAGCGSSDSPLEGSVVFDNRPLEDGSISLFPAGRTGTSLSSDVRAGRYKIDNVPEGKYRVLVSITPKVDTAGKPKLLPNLPLTPKSPGNNAVHDVRAGQKTLDVNISK